MQPPEREGCGRQAAGRQAAKHLPVDAAVVLMDRAADHLGQGGEPEVGADRRGRRDAEQQHQDRRHQRAAADAGHADDRADAEAGERVQAVHRALAARAG